jgi:hypothetical protein
MNMARLVGGFKRLGFNLSRKAPDIAFVAGGALCVLAPIDAVYCTIKHYNEVLDDHNKRLTAMEKAEEKAKNSDRPITKKEHDTMNFVQCAKTTGKFALLYLRPAIEVAGGIALMAYGKHAYKTMYKSTTATLGLATAEIARLKGIMGDALGDSAKELIDGTKTDMVTFKETNENGEQLEKTTFGTILNRPLISSHPYRIGMYTFAIDQTCSIWTASPRNLKSVLRTARMKFQNDLDMNGFVYLNDVLKYLGLPLIEDTSIGWSKLAGSDYIDFGLDNIEEPENMALRENSGEYKYCCILDFNCVGDIRNKMYARQLNERIA